MRALPPSPALRPSRHRLQAREGAGGRDMRPRRGPVHRPGAGVRGPVPGAGARWLRPLQYRSDRSGRSDHVDFAPLFRSDLCLRQSDRSDRQGRAVRGGPTGPTLAGAGRTGKGQGYQAGPTGPTGPTDIEGDATAALPPAPTLASMTDADLAARITALAGRIGRDAARDMADPEAAATELRLEIDALD